MLPRKASVKREVKKELLKILESKWTIAPAFSPSFQGAKRRGMTAGDIACDVRGAD